jgi:hypothetical protein
MSNDLNKGSNPIFDYYIQPDQPNPWWIGTKWLMRFTWWTRLRKKDGSRAVFFNLCLFGRGQAYWGTAKCDGTRTGLLNDGVLGEPTPGYVMTGWKKEHAAFRWRREGSGVASKPHWKGMGSC